MLTSHSPVQTSFPSLRPNLKISKPVRRQPPRERKCVRIHLPSNLSSTLFLVQEIIFPLAFLILRFYNFIFILLSSLLPRFIRNHFPFDMFNKASSPHLLSCCRNLFMRFRGDGPSEGKGNCLKRDFVFLFFTACGRIE